MEKQLKMPEISPVYIKIAENTINLLHIKCNKGIYSDRLFKTIRNGSDKYYPLSKLEWMKDFLEGTNQNIATCCLECLCKHGLDLEEIRDIISNKIKDKLFSLKVIEMAEKYNKPDILLLFMEEDDFYINRVILALKNTNNESYLTTLMLSDNDKLVKSINRIIGDK
jgi:hypothetical protein